MKQRIYIDTSVFGGYFDDEFMIHTRKLFDKFKEGIYEPIISSHTIYELEKGAPDYIIENLKTIDYKKYDINDDIIELAEKYIEQKVVTQKYYDDALHIAAATIIGVDVLVSWNFKHIVNLNRIKLFNSVNIVEKYNILEIRTPREIIENE